MSKEKVGIITYHFARNYGAVLQCYALRKYLEKVGYNATVLNAISRVQEKNNSVFHKKDGLKNVIVNVILLPFVKQRLRKEKGFADFVENYIPHILSIMFGVLYNFYHRKKYKIPVFAIFNLILFAFLRDIATAKLMAVIIVAFLLILEVKDIKFLTPTFSIIFNAFIFFTVVIMQSISNFYVNIFEALGRNATLTYRTTLWSISFKWILERPWFGYGYLDDDSFNFMVKERTTTGLFNTGNPHNTYLTLLLAGGIVLLAFFIFILIRTSRISRECPILITNVLSGFLATLMLHAQVEGRDQACTVANIAVHYESFGNI